MRIRRTYFFVLAALLLSDIYLAAQARGNSSAAALPAATRFTIPDLPYTKFVLSNGLTLLVHEDHKAPMVAVNTWYHVGSKDEEPGKTGFAHLFEHLMFSGSENFNHAYINALEKIGATDLNGTTNSDRTNYFENVPSSMLDYALFAESDRIGYLLGALDQKKLDLQRGVVENEKLQGENEPYGITRQLLAENTYPVGHPYSWTTAGSIKDLDAASIADVQKWFKAYYGAANVTVVIAGDVTPEIAREKVQKYFGEIPPGPPIRRRAIWVAKRSGTRRDLVQDRVPQPRLYRFWNVPQFGSPQAAQLALAAQILGKGKTSRLYKRLVYKDQIATSAVAANLANEIGGQFSLVLTAKSGESMDKVEKAAEEELRRFLRDGPSPAELQVAKTQLFGTFARTMERIGGFGGKSDLLARCQTFTGHADCYKDELEQIRAATPATVRKAANDWLSDGDYILEVQPYPATLKAEGKLDRSKEPAPGSLSAIKLPPMQRTTLSNGLKVVLAERHSAPVVYFSLLVDSGYSADPAGIPGVASLEQRMLEEGTPSRNSLQVAEQLESLSADFKATADLDECTVNLSALKANMDQALGVYADLILHPTFPQNEFARLQKERIAAIQREKTQPQEIGLRVVPSLIYSKGDPYAMPFTGTGTEAAVARMTRDDLVEFHEIWFKPNNAILLIVGDTTLMEITPRLEQLFAGWKPGIVSKKPVLPEQAPGKNMVYLIDRPGSAQSVIFAAQLAPPRNNPDAVRLELINDIFGGVFSSRINMNLREDKHWSYGARSVLLSARRKRPWVVFAPVQANKTRESLEELAREYANIAGEKPISDEELKNAQNYATLSLTGRLETDEELAAAYAQILQYGLPEDYYDTFAQKAISVTREGADQAARQYIDRNRVVWIVLGDLSKVESSIRELGLGEIHRIDVDGNPVEETGSLSPHKSPPSSAH